jgi:cytochrome P450
MSYAGRNPEYIKPFMTYFQLFLPFAVCVRMLPIRLRPLLGFPLRGILQLVARRFLRFLNPLVKDVKGLVERGEQTTETDRTFVKAFIEEIQKTDRVEEAGSIDNVSAVLLTLNFAAIHSTAGTAIKTILNILSHDTAAELMSCLLTEIEVALSATGGVWSLETLNRMKCMDSVLKETLRLDPVETLGIYRMIKKPLTTKFGCLLDVGTKVALSAYTINRNPSQYLNPHQFDPMRFCQPPEENDVQVPNEPTDYKNQEMLRQPDISKKHTKLEDASYTISEEYLSFGYGSHVSSPCKCSVEHSQLIKIYRRVQVDGLQPTKSS